MIPDYVIFDRNVDMLRILRKSKVVIIGPDFVNWTEYY